jgi:hypothetical protein
MLNMEILALCSATLGKQMNALCGRSVGFFNVTPGGKKNNHLAFKG